MEFQTAISVIADHSGDVVKVLHDDLGLALCFGLGTSLKDIVEPGSVPEVERLLRQIRERGVALDVTVQVGCKGSIISLVLSGCGTDEGIHLFAAVQPLSRESLLHELARQSNPETAAALIRSALLALTAHDLRNHLNGIMAANQYLLDDAATFLEPEHVTLLQSIESSGRDMVRVIDDVMQVAVLESANKPLDLTPTDVVVVVRKSVAANRSRAERKKVRLELATATAVPLIAADPARIDGLIDSMLASTTDSVAPGGKIEISFAAEDRRTLVSVRVGNSNITAEQFRSILNTNQPDIEGVKAGMVLAFRVMKRTVEEHGGSIDVAGGGRRDLTITLALPSSGEAPATGHGA